MSLVDQENNNPQVTDLLIQLGMTYLEKGEYDNSIEKFRKAIELGEANAKVYLNLSKAYILKEQFDEESQQIFEKSLQFEPENPVLNILLSQLYLDAGREDEAALKVFQTALKHNPQNADAIHSRLIKLSFQQGTIDTARELMQQFIEQPEKVLSFLPFYVINEWKHQGFERVTQYLKKAIKTQQHPLFYRWLAVNFLQAQRQSSASFELSTDDLNWCHKYLKSISSFDHLSEIYLYPAIERMLIKYSDKLNDASPHGVDEFEIFLAENALSNIWDRGLNRTNSSQNDMIPQAGGVWKKLKLWNGAENEAVVAGAAPKEEKIGEIFSQAETMLVIRLQGATAHEVSPALSISLSTIVDPENTFIGGFQSNDGFILYWKDIDSPIRFAVNFIKDRSLQPTSNLDNQSKFQFLIHKLSRRGKDKQKSLANDLQTALAPFELERELFVQDNHSAQWNNDSRYQVLVTSTLKEKIDTESQFSLEPLTLSSQHQIAEKNIQIYRLTWDDSLAKIKQGKLQEIARFRLSKELYRNPVFTSFKAIDMFLDRLVIIKILNPNFKTNNRQISTQELFIQEAKALGKLSHPNVAMIYDIGNEQNLCYLAREFVEGMPLTIQRSSNKKINIDRTLKICINIAHTLSSLQQLNIFHGRLQPDNIFVLNNTDIKITDFQLASFTSSLKNFHPASLQCLTYVAPEQIADNKFDNLSDIFSLGAIMFELLADHNPFYDVDQDKIFDNILNKNLQPPSYFNSEISERLDHLILKALEKSPEKRCQNMGELEQALSTLI